MTYNSIYNSFLKSHNNQKHSSDIIIDTLHKIQDVLSTNTDIDDALNIALKHLSDLTDASRSYIFSIRLDGKSIDNTHEYCKENVLPQIDYLQGLPIVLFPWWMKKLRNNELIHIKDVSLLPMEAINEKEMLEDQQIKSLISFPIFSDTDVLIGFIGLDNVKKAAEWHEKNIYLLKILSFIISPYITQK